MSDDPQQDASLTALRRLDRHCTAFEEAWKAGETPAIERFLEDAAEVDRAALLRELLLIETAYRRQRGETPSIEEYRSRFPGEASVITEVFEQCASHVTVDVSCDRLVETRSQVEAAGGQEENAGAAAAPRSGERRIGHFELIERLGAGGFGEVWKAQDTKLGRTVAVKMPRKEQLSDDETKRFLREARAAAPLQHPHIVAIHEVGTEAGSPYIVSDFIEGQPLSDWLRSHDIRRGEAVQLSITIAEALHYAHEKGVIHRDLKPANIMIDPGGEPHVMDFGLAKRNVGEVTMTVEGQVLGTPAYMSPEQARGEGHKADRRSDVYAMGVILYEFLTGQRPFQGDLRMVLRQVAEDEPPRPRKLDRGIPRDLETICLKALAKLPEGRYATAEALAGDLKRFRDGEPIQARREWLGARLLRHLRRRPVLSGLIAAGLLMLLAGGVFAWQGIAERRTNYVMNSIEAGLQSDDWDAGHLQRMDSLAGQLEEIDWRQAAAVRRRILDRFVAAIRRQLDRPRLDAAAVERIRSDLALLAARDAPAAAALEEDLQRRLTHWETVAELATPFAELDRVFPPGQVHVDHGYMVPGGRLRTAEGSPAEAVSKTLVPGSTANEIEVEFAADWRTAKRLGVRLNQGEKDGYEFLLRVMNRDESGRAAFEANEPASLAEGEKLRWPAMIEIRRNRVSLGTAECLPWEIPPGPLRLRARRDGESLALWIQEKPPLEIVDLFALGPDEAGCFAVIWPKEVGVQRLQLRRPNMPATASSLEQADGHFAAGRFSEALEDYRRAGETSSDRSVQLESQYKAGACLAKLKREGEAAAAWSRIAARPGDRWPALAACQLLALRLREKNYADADLLLEQLAMLHPWKPLSQLLPADFRRVIVDAYRPSDRIFMIGDRADLEHRAAQMEQARIFWTPGHPAFKPAKDLFCAYWMLNRLDKAVNVAKETVDGLGDHYFDGPVVVLTDPQKYYCWLVRMQSGPAAALKEIDRFCLDASGKPRASALALRVERCRYLWALDRLDEAQRDLVEFIPVAKQNYAAGMELMDAYLVLGMIRDQQGDRAGALRWWREGLELGRSGYHTSSFARKAAPWAQAGSHLLYFVIMGAVTGDLSNDDVGVYLDWNVEQLSGGGALPSMLGNKTLRDHLFPTDRMRSAIRAAWQSPEGYEFARRLARHELGRAEHSRAPVVFALREYLLQNSFSGTPTESQAAVVKDAVDGLLECLVLRGTDVAAVMGLAMAWKGNLLGFGWTSVREKVKDRPELRGVLSYMLAHRMLRLGKPQEAAKLFPAAVADAPKDSLLRRLAQQDLDLLKAGRGRLVVSNHAGGHVQLRVRGEGKPDTTVGTGAETSVAFRSAKERDFRGAKGDNTTVIDSAVLEVESMATVDLAPGAYQLQLAHPRNDVRLTIAKFKIGPAATWAVDVQYQEPPSEHPDDHGYAVSADDGLWKPGPEIGVLPGLAPRPARLPGIGRWNVVTVAPCDPGELKALHWSPDGRLLACCGWRTIRVMDGTGTRLVRLFPAGNACVHDVSFSPDGRWLASADSQRTVRLWNLQTGAAGKVLVGHARELRGVAWSPTGQWLASSAEGGEVRLWHADGTPGPVLSTSGTCDTSLSWTRDGKWLAAGGLRLWSSEGKSAPKIELPPSGPVSFSPDGRWLAVGVNGQPGEIRIVDTGTWQLTAAVYKGAQGPQGHGLVWSPDSQRIAFGGEKHNLYVWEPQKNVVRSFGINWGPRQLTVTGWSADGSTLAAIDGCVRFFDFPSGQVRQTWNGGSWFLRRSPDDKRISCHPTISGWSVWLCSAGGHPERSIPYLGSGGPGAGWSAAGDWLATTAWDPVIRLWKPDGTVIETLHANGPPGNRELAVSPDGTSLVSFKSDAPLELWRVADPEHRLVLSTTAEKVVWRPDGKQFAAIARSGKSRPEIRIWNADGTPVEVPPLPCTDLTWGPDSQWLATCNEDDRIRRWNVHEHRQSDWNGKGEIVWVAWSPNGKWLASAAKQGDVCLWDDEGRPQAIMKYSDHGSLAWSPDSRWLAVRCWWGSQTRLWNVSESKAGPDLQESDDLSWEADSRRLITTGKGPLLRRWDVETGELLSTSVMLPGGNAAYLGRGGKLEVSDPKAEDALAYCVEQPGHILKIYTPAEFRKLAAGHEHDPLPAAHRDADEDRWGLWQDRFDGKSLDGWRHSAGIGKGGVAIEDGALVLENREGMCGVTTTRPVPRKDYEISITTKRISGKDFGSIALPVGDQECAFLVGGDRGDLVSLTTLDGLWGGNNETAQRIRFENNRWYTVRVRVTADRVRGWIDDEEILDLSTMGRRLTLDRLELAPLGLYAWHGKAVIRSIRIRQLKAEGAKDPGK